MKAKAKDSPNQNRSKEIAALIKRVRGEAVPEPEAEPKPKAKAKK